MRPPYSILPSFFFLLLLHTPTLAQKLRGLTENPVIREYRLNLPSALKAAKAGEMLTLPFFEDFSASRVVPDPARWTDSYAFVNNSFAFEPISAGVATLDAINEVGELYALTNVPTASDSLTSLPFDLSPYAGGPDTVRLSFFYQAGGKGEVPEKKDSLLLDYYAPDTDTWKNVWFVTTDTFVTFTQVIRPVPKSYYQSGFRFRFRNYTSLSPDEVKGGEGALSNVDCWNIDYIMMNTEPVYSHRSINDITLVEPPPELLDFYESVPWKHLNEAQSITRNTLHYLARNLADGDSVNVGRSYKVHDLNTGAWQYDEVYFAKFPAASLIRRNDPFYVPFTRSDDSEEGTLEVVAWLITPADQEQQNDTSRTELRFRDYYAYDDGSPEYGFGISGESTAGALLACRFRTYSTDTLRAIDMFFNKTRNNVTAGLTFQLGVWKDAGGVPGDLVYLSAETFSPGEWEGKPGFRRYVFPGDTGLVITDTSFFAGWKQTTDEFLNLGYDVNRNNLDRVFVNISGDWFNPGQSLIPGTPMIRAVFSRKPVATGGGDIPGNGPEISVYPNPATDRIFVRTGDRPPERIRMFDLQGRAVCEQEQEREWLNVSALPEGLYILQLTVDGGRVVSRKVVIRR